MLLKFGVNIRSQTKVVVRKPKNPIWPPGGHFGSDTAGLNNCIGPIARNGLRSTIFASKVARQIGIIEYSGNPFFCAKLQVSTHPRHSSILLVLQNSFHIEQYIYRFCPLSRIQTDVFIQLYIISIALTPVLKYWWRSANNTAVCQVVIKGDINTL